MNSIFSYLFGDSQREQALEGIVENFDAVLDAAGREDALKAKHKPLAKILGAFDVKTGDNLELRPEGFCLVYPTNDEYKAAFSALSTPEAMNELAAGGWVLAAGGDEAMSNELGEFKLIFIDIAEAEGSASEEADETVEEIVRKGREFATEPFEPDPNNPVEHPEAPNEKHAGMGKASDGADPKGTPKGSRRQEALAAVNEREHKKDCGCFICKRKRDKEEEGEDKAPEDFSDMEEAVARLSGRPKKVIKVAPVSAKPKAKPVSKAYKTPRK